jgi:hypothetical protein
MSLQQPPELEDGGFIRLVVFICAQPGKLAQHRGIVECFFQSQLAEPLLHQKKQLDVEGGRCRR